MNDAKLRAFKERCIMLVGRPDMLDYHQASRVTPYEVSTLRRFKYQGELQPSSFKHDGRVPLFDYKGLFKLLESKGAIA